MLQMQARDALQNQKQDSPFWQAVILHPEWLKTVKEQMGDDELRKYVADRGPLASACEKLEAELAMIKRMHSSRKR